MKLRKEDINEGFSESITVNYRICIDSIITVEQGT